MVYLIVIFKCEKYYFISAFSYFGNKDETCSIEIIYIKYLANFNWIWFLVLLTNWKTFNDYAIYFISASSLFIPYWIYLGLLWIIQFLFKNSRIFNFSYIVFQWYKVWNKEKTEKYSFCNNFNEIEINIGQTWRAQNLSTQSRCLIKINKFA